MAAICEVPPRPLCGRYRGISDIEQAALGKLDLWVRALIAAVAVQHFPQLGQEWLLVGDDLLARRVVVEPAEPIDLRKACAPARARRPFHLELIAGKMRDVEIAFVRPGVHGLSALLPYRPQRQKFALGEKA